MCDVGLCHARQSLSAKWKLLLLLLNQVLEALPCTCLRFCAGKSRVLGIAVFAGIWVEPPLNCTNGPTSYCLPIPGTDFTCQYSYKSSNVVCQAAVGPCDLASTCPGDAALCPPAQKKANCPPTCPSEGLPACVNSASGLSHTLR